MGATNSLFIHWCWLGLRCVDMPEHPYNHIGKVTTSKWCQPELTSQPLSKVILKCIAIDGGNSSTIILLKLIHLFDKWCSNMAVWVPPIACSYTDVDLDSDMWICLDIHTTILAKSQPANVINLSYKTSIHPSSSSSASLFMGETQAPSSCSRCYTC